MEDNYYQLTMTFPSKNLQGEFKNELELLESEKIILDENIDELYADDPLTIVLLVTLATEVVKSIGKESISWLFDKIKKKLDKTNNQDTSGDIITIKIKVLDKQFDFKYNQNTQDYIVEETK